MCDYRGIPPTLMAWASKTGTLTTVIEKWEEIWHGVKVFVNSQKGVVAASKVFPTCCQIFGWNFDLRQLSPSKEGIKRDADFLDFLIRSFNDSEGYRILTESQIKKGGRSDKFYLISLCHGRQKRFISSLVGPNHKQSLEDVNIVPKTRQDPVLEPEGVKVKLTNLYGGQVSISGASKITGYIPNPLLTPQQQQIQLKWRREQEERDARKNKSQIQSQPPRLMPAIVPSKQGQVRPSSTKITDFPTLGEAADSGKQLGSKKPSSNLPQGPKSWNKLF